MAAIDRGRKGQCQSSSGTNSSDTSGTRWNESLFETIGTASFRLFQGFSKLLELVLLSALLRVRLSQHREAGYVRRLEGLIV